MHECGSYVLLHSVLLEGEEGSQELQQGQEVQVVELKEEDGTWRARVQEPKGWFTLRQGTAVPRSEWHSEPRELQDIGP